MEVACGLLQENVFYGGAVAGCKAAEQLDLKPKLKHKHFGCTALGDLRLKRNAYSLMNLKKSTAYLWMYHCSSNGCSVYDGHIVKISKHLGLSQCHKNEPIVDASEDGEINDTVENKAGLESVASGKKFREEGTETPCLNALRELLQLVNNDFVSASINHKLYEEKTQRKSEAAIASKEEAANAQNDVSRILVSIQEIVNEEAIAKKGVLKATMALSLAEETLQMAIESAKTAQEIGEKKSSEEEVLFAAEQDLKACQNELPKYEAELSRVQSRKEELLKELDVLNAIAKRARFDAYKAEEEAANIMLLAEQAIAYELQAAQHVNDAELALKRAERDFVPSYEDTPDSVEEATISEQSSADVAAEEGREVLGEAAGIPKRLLGGQQEESGVLDKRDKEIAQLSADQLKETKSMPVMLKTIQNEEKFSPASGFWVFLEIARKQLPKLMFGLLLLGAGFVLKVNQSERVGQLHQQPQIITTTVDQISTNAKHLGRQIILAPKMKKLIEMLSRQEVNEEEAVLCDVLWLLFASVVFVPIFQNLPGGSPVLGYLAAGVLIGPHGLSIIRSVQKMKAIAEFGVVFLLFNIGLELSVERLNSLKKYVFGLGSAQVLATAVVVGLLCHHVAGLPSPAAIVIGSGLALSPTAVVLQVLQERGENTSCHGRTTFSVLLFQDLAVVVLLILIPLISPSSSNGGVGFWAIVEVLGLAAVKAYLAIFAIVAGGRMLFHPIFKQITKTQDTTIFTATTLLVILGTSLFTARAGLSMGLGAFLAGLLLAETKFSLQIESEMNAYRGILLGLFFMMVGMSIDSKCLVSNFTIITRIVGLLIAGKTTLVALVGRLFGLPMASAIRVGLLLAPGGEFAFLAFGEAVKQGLMSSQLSSLLFLVVGISMAITPWLASGGQLIESQFELQHVRNLLQTESKVTKASGFLLGYGFTQIKSKSQPSDSQDDSQSSKGSQAL